MSKNDFNINQFNKLFDTANIKNKKEYEEKINELKKILQERMIKDNMNINEIQEELFNEVLFGIIDNTTNPYQIKKNINIDLKKKYINDLIDSDKTLFNKVFTLLKKIKNENSIKLYKDILQNHLDILINLQINLNKITGINDKKNDEIPKDIKNLYRKFLDYLEKIVILKMWKDLKILELFGIMFVNIIPGIKDNLKKFYNNIPEPQPEPQPTPQPIPQPTPQPEPQPEPQPTPTPQPEPQPTSQPTPQPEPQPQPLTKKELEDLYEDCIKNIMNEIDDFLGNIDVVQVQGGEGKTKLQYKRTDDINIINEHIKKLKDGKEGFEKALEKNIQDFDKICDAFIELLESIKIIIKDFTDKISYINVINIEKNIDELTNNNKKLINTLLPLIKSKKYPNV